MLLQFRTIYATTAAAEGITIFTVALGTEKGDVIPLKQNDFSTETNIKMIGLRFFSVYGPYGRPDMAYYNFLDSLRNNKPIKVFNRGISS